MTTEVALMTAPFVTLETSLGLYRRRPGIEDSTKQDKYEDAHLDRDTYLDRILVTRP